MTDPATPFSSVATAATSLLPEDTQKKVLGDAGEIADTAKDAVASIKAGELQYTVLQPVAVYSAKAVNEADSFLKTGKTGASAEKQLFDCLLITKDNLADYIAPFTLKQ